ncbi:MAG: GGDEF domain-containing protein [Woeseiaceae bacterium]|nr:GGDEF domain-containing protein [Woeseiaceae bacterium]
MLCSVVWFAIEWNDGYSFSNAAVPAWNAFVRLVFFLVVAQLLAALHTHLQKERQLARTDPLTGLLNARAFRERLAHDIAVTERNGGTLTLTYIDVDDSKRVNDMAGHGEGDQLLRSMADRLTKGTRRADTVARLGGDEFGLVLPATDLDGAETLLLGLAEILAQMTAAGGPVTCSIGAAVFHALPG